MQKRKGPYDAERNERAELTRTEIRIVYQVDGMDRSVESREADFLNSVITKLKEHGEDNATFSAKQRNWIHSLGEKYLD